MCLLITSHKFCTYGSLLLLLRFESWYQLSKYKASATKAQAKAIVVELRHDFQRGMWQAAEGCWARNQVIWVEKRALKSMLWCTNVYFIKISSDINFGTISVSCSQDLATNSESNSKQCTNVYFNKKSSDINFVTICFVMLYVSCSQDLAPNSETTNLGFFLHKMCCLFWSGQSGLSKRVYEP